MQWLEVALYRHLLDGYTTTALQFCLSVFACRCVKTWWVQIFTIQSCYMQTPRSNPGVKFDPKNHLVWVFRGPITKVKMTSLFAALASSSMQDSASILSRHWFTLQFTICGPKIGISLHTSQNKLGSHTVSQQDLSLRHMDRFCRKIINHVLALMPIKNVCNIQCNIGYSSYHFGMIGRYNYKMPMEFFRERYCPDPLASVKDNSADDKNGWVPCFKWPNKPSQKLFF